LAPEPTANGFLGQAPPWAAPVPAPAPRATPRERPRAGTTIGVAPAGDGFEAEAEAAARAAAEPEVADGSAGSRADRPDRIGGADPFPEPPPPPPSTSRAVGPAAIAATPGPEFQGRLGAALDGQGRSLPGGLRTALELRLGAGFEDVRVHDDGEASQLAAMVRAKAFTVGSDVFFRAGQYRPETPGGQRLLAHELAHVAQQGAPAAATAAPVIQRAPEDEGAAPAAEPAAAPAAKTARSEADDFTALLIRITNPRELVAGADTDVLLATAPRLHEQFSELDAPRTRAAAADALLEIQRVLALRASSAPRGPDGELMMKDSFGTTLVPWAPGKPRSLDDIPPFQPGNVQAWAAAALSERQAALSQRPAGGAATAKPAAKHQTARTTTASGADAKKASATEAEPTIDVSSGLGGSSPDQGEKATGGGEVRRGIAALRSVTIGQLVNAVAARQPDPDAPVAKATLPANGASSLFTATGLVLFVAPGRLFLLERSGRIIEPGGLAAELGLEPSKFQFELQGTTLAAGGVFFLSPFQLVARQAKVAQRSLVTLRIDGGNPRIDGGDIFPSQTNEGLLRVLPIAQETIRSGAGIGIIISSHIHEKPELNRRNVRRALVGVFDHLGDELGAQIEAIVENPLPTLFGIARGEAEAELKKRIAGFGAISALKQAFDALLDVAWFATVASVAAHARSDDEIDIVSQLLARRLAAFIIGDLIRRGHARAKAAVKKIIGRIGSAGSGGGRGRQGKQSGGGGDEKQEQQQPPPPAPGGKTGGGEGESSEQQTAPPAGGAPAPASKSDEQSEATQGQKAPPAEAKPEAKQEAKEEAKPEAKQEAKEEAKQQTKQAEPPKQEPDKGQPAPPPQGTQAGESAADETARKSGPTPEEHEEKRKAAEKGEEEERQRKAVEARRQSDEEEIAKAAAEAKATGKTTFEVLFEKGKTDDKAASAFLSELSKKLSPDARAELESWVAKSKRPSEAVAAIRGDPVKTFEGRAASAKVHAANAGNARKLDEFLATSNFAERGDIKRLAAEGKPAAVAGRITEELSAAKSARESPAGTRSLRSVRVREQLSYKSRADALADPAVQAELGRSAPFRIVEENGKVYKILGEVDELLVDPSGKIMKMVEVKTGETAAQGTRQIEEKALKGIQRIASGDKSVELVARTGEDLTSTVDVTSATKNKIEVRGPEDVSLADGTKVSQADIKRAAERIVAEARNRPPQN
jgi:hypothetical protein